MPVKRLGCLQVVERKVWLARRTRWGWISAPKGRRRGHRRPTVTMNLISNHRRSVPPCVDSQHPLQFPLYKHLSCPPSHENSRLDPKDRFRKQPNAVVLNSTMDDGAVTGNGFRTICYLRSRAHRPWQIQRLPVAPLSNGSRLTPTIRLFINIIHLLPSLLIRPSLVRSKSYAIRPTSCTLRLTRICSPVDDSTSSRHPSCIREPTSRHYATESFVNNTITTATPYVATNYSLFPFARTTLSLSRRLERHR
jgi:hypothetical protein